MNLVQNVWIFALFKAFFLKFERISLEESCSRIYFTVAEGMQNGRNC